MGPHGPQGVRWVAKTNEKEITVRAGCLLVSLPEPFIKTKNSAHTYYFCTQKCNTGLKTSNTNLWLAGASRVSFEMPDYGGYYGRVLSKKGSINSAVRDIEGTVKKIPGVASTFQSGGILLRNGLVRNTLREREGQWRPEAPAGPGENTQRHGEERTLGKDKETNW